MDRFSEMTAFVKVAERRGFAAAARDLGRSAPAVTRLISNLEARLGSQLIIRTTRSLRLTESGERFLAECRALLSSLDEAEDMARGIHAAPRGTLRITAPLLFGRYYVAPGVAAFVEHHPDVSAETMFIDRNVNLMDEGIDVAFRIGNLEDSGLAAIRVGSVRRICVAAPDYLHKFGAPQVPDDLSEHRLLHANAVDMASTWPFHIDGTTINLSIDPVISFNTNDPAIDLACEGRGITNVLSYQVEAQLRDGSLVEILEQFAVPAVPVNILHLEGRRTSAKVRAFVDFMSARLRAAPALRSGT